MQRGCLTTLLAICLLFALLLSGCGDDAAMVVEPIVIPDFLSGHAYVPQAQTYTISEDAPPLRETLLTLGWTQDMLDALSDEDMTAYAGCRGIRTISGYVRRDSDGECHYDDIEKQGAFLWMMLTAFDMGNGDYCLMGDVVWLDEGASGSAGALVLDFFIPCEDEATRTRGYYVHNGEKIAFSTDEIAVYSRADRGAVSFMLPEEGEVTSLHVEAYRTLQKVDAEQYFNVKFTYLYGTAGGHTAQFGLIVPEPLTHYPPFHGGYIPSSQEDAT